MAPPEHASSSWLPSAVYSQTPSPRSTFGYARSRKRGKVLVCSAVKALAGLHEEAWVAGGLMLGGLAAARYACRERGEGWFFLGGLVPATLALLLAREARRERMASAGYLTGGRSIRVGVALAWVGIVLAATALVIASIVGLLHYADSRGSDFAPNVN